MSKPRWDETQASPATAEALKYGRRLTDKILIAFHHACDSEDILTAEELLGTLGEPWGGSSHGQCFIKTSTGAKSPRRSPMRIIGSGT